MDKLHSSSYPRWYTLPIETVEEKFSVSKSKGLSLDEALERKKTYGENILIEEKNESIISMFLRQYKDYMQIILLSAGFLSLFIGNFVTTLLLFGITVMNAILGIHSEKKAANSVAALKKMMKTKAKTLRNGKFVILPIEELVPGDIVEFETGDIVPADGRIFYAAGLEIEESALTGESVPVVKSTGTLTPNEGSDIPIGDRVNMGFMNTIITRGKGKMIVTATGMNTEVGMIASMLGSVKEEKTPLTKQIDQLGVLIAVIAAVSLVFLIGIGLFNGEPFSDLFTLGIALAVAAVPTSLPVAMSLMLTIGTMELAKLGAIVKRLPSVETLGSTSAICSDKTGTLTMNQMTARELIVAGKRMTVTGEGYNLNGQIQHVAGTVYGSLDSVLLPMVLCSDAVIHDGTLVGDPTEGALVILAEKGDIDVEATREAYPRIAEVPFDSSYKFMATFHEMIRKSDETKVIRCYVKGAPDVLLERSSHFIDNEDNISSIEGHHDIILGINRELGEKGMRVLMVAFREYDPLDFDPKDVGPETILDLTIVSMVGIIDPPRPEVKAAVDTCRTAGIQVRMITGDHSVTAGAIAEQLHIPGDVITGLEMAGMSDEELMEKIDDIGVVARVGPEHKVRLVEILKEKGNIVAMTGDGVNDAPALKAADIGVAMGISGSEVSKQSADMILTDDNFATIVSAVKRGRILHDNISKFINFQMTNLAAYILLFIFAALFLGMYSGVLTPLQTLFMNFLVTTPLEIALCYDTARPGVMTRKPRPKNQRLISAKVGFRLFLIGLYWGAAPLIAYVWIISTGASFEIAMGLIMVVFILLHIPFTAAVRYANSTIFRKEFLSNKYLYGAFLLTVLWAVLVTESGFFHRIFGTASLPAEAWIFAILLTVLALFGTEIGKLVVRIMMRRKDRELDVLTIS